MGRLEVLTATDRLPLPRSACRYQRLRGVELGGGSTSPAPPGGSVRARRPLRLRRRACKAAGRWGATTTAASGGGRKRLRLRLVRLLLLLPARRVAALVAELLRRLAAAVAAEAAADCPAIVFSSQWGLPVLSHSGSTASSSRSARLRAFYLDRSLSAGSSSGTASPC